MSEMNDFKIAILLLGNIRTWESCKESFQQTFGMLNADVFVDTYDLRYGYHPYINGRFEGDDELLTPDQIKIMFEGINVVNFNIDSAEERHAYYNSTVNTLHPNFQNMENCFAQSVKLVNAFIPVMHTEYVDGKEYDIIIKTRCDMVYNPVNFSQILNKVIIDSGNVYPNDCIIMSDRDTMFNIAKMMHAEYFIPELGSDTHEVPPHRLLQRAVEKLELEFDAQKIMDYVMRRNNIPQRY
jgi:hypothetical protein